MQDIVRDNGTVAKLGVFEGIFSRLASPERCLVTEM